MNVVVLSLEFSRAKRWAGDKGRMFLKSTYRKEGRPDQPNSEAKKTLESMAMGPRMLAKCQTCWVKNKKMASVIISSRSQSMPAF
jgi:hypothetical protein